MRAFGARSRIPMLWVYAQNDRYFAPHLATRLASASRQGGGDTAFVELPAYGTDGHDLFSEAGDSIWAPIVDRFVRAHGLPGVDIASTSAALGPPAEIGTRAHPDFRSYLRAPAHKAFAVGANGAYAWRTARDTTSEAIERALEHCRSIAGQVCRLYAVDDAYAKH